MILSILKPFSSAFSIFKKMDHVEFLFSENCIVQKTLKSCG